MERPRILLADDHEATLEVVASILASEFDVVGKVSNGRDAVAVAAEVSPDLIILDISMPLMDGLAAARRLQEDGSMIPVIFLSVHEEPDFIDEAASVGGLGYVFKAKVNHDLVPAIREALHGHSFVSQH